jgi:mono/diheme cytochrome c family protein
MRGFFAGVVFALAAAAVVGLSVGFLGLAPVNADQRPSTVEARILGIALRKAVGRRAAEEQELPPASSEDLTSGGEIYHEMCARCHGEPGKTASRLGASFYPPAPELPGHSTEWSERELFWIIKHGIRNTAMPAWGRLLSDDDIRQVAALVKRFDTARIPARTAEAGAWKSR